MVATSETFKEGMRRLGGAVNIVTAANGDLWSGLTATAVCSLSAEPPRLLACINRVGATYDVLSHGRNICVNVLSSQHQELAMRFAGMGGLAETERFEADRWTLGLTGAPKLDDALVNFDCEIESILDSGSHGVVIGRIIDISVNKVAAADPLIYIDGQFATTSGL